MLIEFLGNSPIQTNQTKQKKQKFIKLDYLNWWIHIVQLYYVLYSNGTVWWTFVLFNLFGLPGLCEFPKISNSGQVMQD